MVYFLEVVFEETPLGKNFAPKQWQKVEDELFPIPQMEWNDFAKMPNNTNLLPRVEALSINIDQELPCSHGTFKKLALKVKKFRRRRTDQ
jgi:hypothetical protein